MEILQGQTLKIIHELLPEIFRLLLSIEKSMGGRLKPLSMKGIDRFVP